MKFKAIRRIALIFGSLLAAIQLMLVFGIFGRSTVFDSNGGSLYLFVLPPLLMVIAWFNSKWGAFLLILLPIITLFFSRSNGNFDMWLELSAPFILVGLLLLYYVFYNKKGLNKNL